MSTNKTETKFPRQSIGRQRAIDLYNSGWWKGCPASEIAKFQLFTDELCMPFDVFHEAMEKTLNRPVWTHEFALDFDGLCLELLKEKDPPSIQEIIELLPEEKRIIVQL